MPGLGLSLILITVGAILAFAVNEPVEGIEVPTVGAILMVVGGIGLLISLFYMTSLWPFTRTTYVAAPPVADHDHVGPVDHTHETDHLHR